MQSENEILFHNLRQIYDRPKPFEFYTAGDLWTDDHVSAQMLKFHLDQEVDLASRNHAFIERSVAWMADHFRIGSETRIADFGCGPGLYAMRLAQHGAKVTGIDFSARSIQYAEDAAADEGIDVSYVHQDYMEFDTEDRFDLIIMIMCDFCALSPEQRHTLLRSFQGLLAPGGSLLLDVNSLTAFTQREECATIQFNLMDGFWSSDQYFGFLNTFKYPDEAVVLDKYTIVEERRTRVVYNWFQYFTPDRLQTEFAAAGLRVDEMYADVAGSAIRSDDSEFAVVATKRPTQ